jgi:hypothetical protein
MDIERTASNIGVSVGGLDGKRSIVSVLYKTRSSHADFDLIKLDVGHGKKAIVIFVPVPSLQGFHKVQQRYGFVPFPLPCN